MSLHLGNLSPRVRRDELERVFRKFGRCTVQVKDKFGFVIYDFPANAEKALRSLRGKNICGEHITVSWSNRQPRSLQQIDKPSYLRLQRRQSKRDAYGTQRLGRNIHENLRKGFRHPHDSGEILGSGDLADGQRSYGDDLKEFVEEENQPPLTDYPDEVGAGEADFLENDRWEEQNLDHLIETGSGNNLEFDRYEPYLDNDGKDQDELAEARGLSPGRSSQEKTGTEQVGQLNLKHTNNAKSQISCYRCGRVGHKMHECPKERESFETGGRESHRHSMLKRRYKDDRPTSSFRNSQKIMRHGVSSLGKVTYGSGRNNFRDKKRRKEEHQSPERSRVKKPREALPSSFRSDYAASRSRSRSLSGSSRSFSRSRSNTRLKDEHVKRSSSSSRSGSTSRHSRSRELNPRSVPRSSSPTSLSLSVSLGRPLTPPSNKVQIDQNDTGGDIEDPKSNEPVDGELQMKTHAMSLNARLETSEVAIQGAVAESKGTDSGDLDVEVEGELNNVVQRRHNVHGDSVTRDLFETKDSHMLQADNMDYDPGPSSPLNLRESRPDKVDEFTEEYVLTQNQGQGLRISEMSQMANRISSAEMNIVLKHYGLRLPEETSRNLPLETHLGAARLWPWEIIYYRRLMKGPISIENYHRRIAQNREFGIVDKYIRSSSGWGEAGEVDF